MAKGIMRMIKKALVKVNREMTVNAAPAPREGLVGEGYAGGYHDALCDVLLALNGGKPDRRDYWE